MWLQSKNIISSGFVNTRRVHLLAVKLWQIIISYSIFVPQVLPYLIIWCFLLQVMTSMETAAVAPSGVLVQNLVCIDTKWVNKVEHVLG